MLLLLWGKIEQICFKSRKFEAGKFWNLDNTGKTSVHGPSVSTVCWSHARSPQKCQGTLWNTRFPRMHMRTWPICKMAHSDGLNQEICLFLKISLLSTCVYSMVFNDFKSERAFSYYCTILTFFIATECCFFCKYTLFVFFPCLICPCKCPQGH